MTLSAETWQAIVSGNRQGPSTWLARRMLSGISVPYGLAVRTRNALFARGWKKVHRASVPVISIGNLTLGGTGKTPCVEYTAGLLRQHDQQVAILSRGYGAEGGRNDEAMLLEENLPDVPHLQGRDRVALAATAVEELESDVLVLDDGFQHRRLHRDLDIVLIDASNPWGFNRMFPRGALREPVSGLKRAGLVMITRVDRADDTAIQEIRRRVARYTDATIALTVHEPIALLTGDGSTEPIESLRGATVAAFAGIGNPDAFRRTLETAGATVVEFRVFPDHHGYTRADVDDLIRWASSQPAETLIATTQKDMVKLRIAMLGDRPLRAVRIGLKFLEGQDAFDAKVLSAAG